MSHPLLPHFVGAIENLELVAQPDGCQKHCNYVSEYKKGPQKTSIITGEYKYGYNASGA